MSATENRDENPDLNDPDADSCLIRSLKKGDSQALRTLMARYDPLVRFTIHRVNRAQSLRDPEWLDSMASEVWSGFVASMRKSAQPPRDLKLYLIQLARNKCVDFFRVRGQRRLGDIEDLSTAKGLFIDGPTTHDLVATLEDLKRLRTAIAGLGEKDQALCSQLDLIMEKRWREAAVNLGMPESTLRSRWAVILSLLRDLIRAS